MPSPAPALAAPAWLRRVVEVVRGALATDLCGKVTIELNWFKGGLTSVTWDVKRSHQGTEFPPAQSP